MTESKERTQSSGLVCAATMDEMRGQWQNGRFLVLCGRSNASLLLWGAVEPPKRRQGNLHCPKFKYLGTLFTQDRYGSDRYVSKLGSNTGQEHPKEKKIEFSQPR